MLRPVRSGATRNVLLNPKLLLFYNRLVFRPTLRRPRNLSRAGNTQLITRIRGWDR